MEKRKFKVGDYVRCIPSGLDRLFKITMHGPDPKRRDCCEGCWELSGGFTTHESSLILDNENKMNMEETKHIWGVRIKLPPDAGAVYKWWNNKFFRVLAATLEGAAKQTKAKYPSCVILAITHDGELLE